MITQRDIISQEVVSAFRRRPKVIKYVKVRNEILRDLEKEKEKVDESRSK